MKTNARDFAILTAYRRVKVLRVPDHNAYRVELYLHRSGRYAIVKSYDYQRKDLFYRLLKNEATLLEMLSSMKSRYARFPQLYTVVDKNKRLLIIREYIEGKPVEKLPKSARIEAFDLCYKALRDITRRMRNNTTQYPHRTSTEQFISFPFFLVRAMIKEPGTIGTLTYLALIFYRQYLTRGAFDTSFELAHRDLTSANIIDSKDGFTIIDLATAIFAEEGTDLSLFPRFYLRELDMKAIRKYVLPKLDSIEKKRRFVRLTIFYAVHYMSISKKSNRFYVLARDYLHVFKKQILPYIRSRRVTYRNI